ncbi:Lanthionine synthetase C-like protein [Dyadobacter koreensis]|uniref:Lanthionine synthetase C-like protein n=2 Tax=Dyadobacter koreensis TaxID=408657 RepID=A0A1H7AWK1_9BACT|nr:Lanthionine synthetase C-like protein [Dyadobacter koreensis]
MLDGIIKTLERDLHTDETGAFWVTFDLVNGKKTEQIHETIYNGVAGISLFFLDLYKEKNLDKYRKIVLSNEKWLHWYCTQNPTDNYAFLTGRMGICYYYIQLYNTFKNDEYLNKAKGIAKESRAFIATHGLMEYLNGISGTLLTLLHLYSISPEAWILEYLRDGVERVISEAEIWEVGIYWDRSIHQIHGLCGLSHGAAGIGFVLIEIGNYFRQPHLISIGELAYTYEESHFDTTHSNWPDLRKYVGRQERIQEFDDAFDQGNYDQFCRPLDSNLWCHGAAGICLTRLRAFEITSKKKYFDEVVKSVSKIIETDVDRITHDSNILCHGRAGNLAVLLALGNLENQNAINRLCQHILDSRRRKGGFGSGYNFLNDDEDKSLFMGTAGIGYMFQKLNSGNKECSILLPSLNSDNTSLSPEVGRFRNSIYDKLILLERAFPRTAQILNNLYNKKFEKQIDVLSVESLLENFTLIVKSYADEIDFVKVSEAFQFERQKLDQDHSIASNSLIYFSERANVKWVHGITSDPFDICLYKYKRSRFVNLATTSWNWSVFHNPLKAIEFTYDDLHYYGLRSTALGIKEQQISELSYYILFLLGELRTFEELILSLFEVYNLENHLKDQLRVVVKKLVIDGVGTGLIHCSTNHT